MEPTQLINIGLTNLYKVHRISVAFTYPWAYGRAAGPIHFAFV